MGGKRKELSFLYRIWKNATEKNTNILDEVKETEQESLFEEGLQESPEEDFTDEEDFASDNVEDKTSFEVMPARNNYLAAVRSEFRGAGEDKKEEKKEAEGKTESEAKAEAEGNADIEENQGALKEEAENVYYADFMLEFQEADQQMKGFLNELQMTAKEFLEMGKREVQDVNKDQDKEKAEDVNEPVNAQVCIKLSPDEMEAWMFAFPPKNGGKEFTEELIYEALDQCRVYAGIDKELVKKIVRKKAYLKIAVVAHGLEPVDGVEGKIIDYFPRIPYIAAEDQERSVDFKNLDWLHPVTEGTVICDLVYPIESIDGSKVTGETIRGKALKPFIIPYGTNTELNEEGNALISNLDGTLYFENGKFHVKEVLNILSDVDLSVGNIDTIGNVDIRGDVLSGFSVKATGNIKIRGMVGCSTIIAGGDIKIGMGIKGCGDGFIQAGGDVECSYMENCEVKAKGNVTSGSIVNCDVSSDRNVESKVIVGGSVAALRQVHAKTVGNVQRRSTSFSLGNTQDVRQEKIALETSLDQLKQNMEKLGKNIRFLQNKSKLTPEEEEKCSIFQLEYKSYKEQQERTMERLQEINEGIQDYSECELTANVLNPPVTVTIAGDTCVIEQGYNMVRIWSEDGEIRIQ